MLKAIHAGLTELATANQSNIVVSDIELNQEYPYVVADCRDVPVTYHVPSTSDIK